MWIDGAGLVDISAENRKQHKTRIWFQLRFSGSWRIHFLPIWTHSPGFQYLQKLYQLYKCQCNLLDPYTLLYVSNKKTFTKPDSPRSSKTVENRKKMAAHHYSFSAFVCSLCWFSKCLCTAAIQTHSSIFRQGWTAQFMMLLVIFKLHCWTSLSWVVSSSSALKQDLIIWWCRPVIPLTLILCLTIGNKICIAELCVTTHYFTNFSVDIFISTESFAAENKPKIKTSSVEFFWENSQRAAIIWGAASVGILISVKCAVSWQQEQKHRK